MMTWWHTWWHDDHKHIIFIILAIYERYEADFVSPTTTATTVLLQHNHPLFIVNITKYIPKYKHLSYIDIKYKMCVYFGII